MNMTRNNVFEHIFTAHTYHSMITSMMYSSAFNNHDVDEIKSELILQLDKGNYDLVNLYEKNQLKYVMSAIASKQIKSEKSFMYYKYIKKKKSNDEYDELAHSSYTTDIYKQIDDKTKIKDINKFLSTHEKKSSKLKIAISIYRYYYIDLMSIAQISELLNTCISNVYKYLSYARDYIKENFNTEKYD